MEPMEVDGEGERRKDKKKHKKSKKPEGDGEGGEEGRRERKKEKKERKKSRRRQRDEEPAGEGLVGGPGGGSPSWTATGATIPNAAEQLLNDTNTVQTNAANHHHPRESDSRTMEPDVPLGGGAGQAAGDELSIEATNKLRASLGLKPLQVAGAPGDAAATATKKEDVHAPPTNIAQVKKAAKVKERLDTVKTKHQLEKKIRATKGLAEASDEEESAESWVERNRRVVEARRQAALQAEMQKRADGVQDDEDEPDTRPVLPYYAAGELRGLKVEHDLQRFREGQDIVLTLKDTGILEESEGDVLMSTALREEEKLEKNLENRKKKPLYNPYEDADSMQRPVMLKKYDEVIGGERQGQFVLDTGGRALGKADERAETAAGTPFRADMLQTLLTSSQTLARDFYNEEEMAGKFKKVKKSARSRRHTALKDEPLGSVQEEFVGGGAVEDEADDVELQLALSRGRRMRQQAPTETVGADFIESQMQQRETTLTDTKVDGRMFLDATSEFCRTVGAVSAAGRAVKEEVVETVVGGAERDEYPDPDTAEDMEIEEEERPLAEEKKGGWSEVQFEAEPANLGSDPEDEQTGGNNRRPRRTRPNSGQSSHVRSILDDEPSAGKGVGSTLALAMRKGLIDEAAEVKKAALLRSNLKGKKSSVPPQNYTVEDKIIDDDKRGRHERYSGPLVAFKERPGYTPGFKLAYHDAAGRLLDQKAAFRDLSHKFHGKGSGKMKTEKRTKKFNEAKLLMEMSSVDTPLGTVAKMKAKQAEQATPFLLLSGANAAKAHAHLHPPTPLSKKS